MLDELTVEQAEELKAFYQLEPFGVIRDDLRMGVIASMIANALRKKKSDEIKRPGDFLLFSDLPEKLREKRKERRSKFMAAIARAEDNIKRRREAAGGG